MSTTCTVRPIPEKNRRDGRIIRRRRANEKLRRCRSNGSACACRTRLQRRNGHLRGTRGEARYKLSKRRHSILDPSYWRYRHAFDPYSLLFPFPSSSWNRARRTGQRAVTTCRGGIADMSKETVDDLMTAVGWCLASKLIEILMILSPTAFAPGCWSYSILAKGDGCRHCTLGN